MMPGSGLGEWIVSVVAVMFSLALPLAILFLLYKIYIKRKNIEEQVRKN
jgi:hypothetical protein